MNFATYKLIMAGWGLLGTVCTASMYLRELVRTRRMAVNRVPAGRS